MHDIYLANRILKIVLRKAKNNKLERITDITIDLGAISEHNKEVSPANLKFNFDLLSKGTLAEGAYLRINKAKGSFFKIKEIGGDRIEKT